MTPKRNFQDFVVPAIRGLSTSVAKRVALALDTAIVFGALEYLEGNESLQDRNQLTALYGERVKKLKEL